MATQSLPEKEDSITITSEQFDQIYEAAAFFGVLASTLNAGMGSAGDAAILLKPVAQSFWEFIDGIQDEVSRKDRERERAAEQKSS